MRLDWNDAYREYAAAGRISRGDQLAVLSRLASRLPRDLESEYAGAIEALRDIERRWFVADLLGHANRVPRVLLRPLVLAGIAERDASLNNTFLGPATRTDLDLACDIVTTALSEGDDESRLSAARALYWVQPSRASAICHARCRERIELVLRDPHASPDLKALLRRYTEHDE